MDNSGYLAAAFLATATILAAYVWLLRVRLAAVRERTGDPAGNSAEVRNTERNPGSD